MHHIAPVTSTGLTITNPLVLYRALLATKRVDPDPSQHRLALHLQKLYHRLKDYEPTVEYRARLRQINLAVGTPTVSLASENGSESVTSSKSSRNGILASLLAQKERRETLALTEVLTSQEEALRLDSPRGLLLYGEVGTGKSMLVDLLADCLPSKKKRRWHFNTFMLETFSRLEQIRRQQLVQSSVWPDGRREEYSLLVLARDMISTSPILFLDEFQLPDRAASKILLNLLTSFFQLGGVLVATSNRMPDELAKASGMEFAPAPASPGGLGWSLAKSWSSRRPTQEQCVAGPGGRGEFAGFLEVLKARCEVWDMEGGKDWRRREVQPSTPHPNPFDDTVDDSVNFNSLPTHVFDTAVNIDTTTTTTTPANYHVSPPSSPSSTSLTDPTSCDTSIITSLLHLRDPIPWRPLTLHIYARPLLLPYTHLGYALLSFSSICGTALGPADYITLASTFHTIILTDLPVLTLLHKNEARRLITLLDALYEARCKLLVLRAARGPDSLFFPDAHLPNSDTASSHANTSTTATTTDALHAETLAEAYQDMTAPFRPNISIYDDNTTDQTSTPSVEPQTTSDGPPGAGNEIGRTIDFANVAAYTGEDERFAYRRAASRLWEMCGARWWARGDEGSDDSQQPGWWRPLGREVRRWEGVKETDAEGSMTRESSKVDVDKVFKHGASPFRVSSEPPPKIWGGVHAWGMMQWGKKAGRWGKGVEALVEERAGTGRSGRDEEEGHMHGEGKDEK